MTDKELRRLNRGELLKMLLAETEENEALRQKLAQREKELSDRRISLDECGSIAQAALSLNGVFEAAQSAAEQYLENVRQMTDRQDEICKRMQDEAEEKARRILNEAREESEKIRREADAYSARIREEAEAFQRGMPERAEQLCEKIRREAEAFCGLVSGGVKS